MAYELLTGAHPFPGGVRDVADLDGRRITPMAQHGLRGSDSLDAFFARALSHDAAARPAAAREFLARFERAMAPGAGAAAS